MRVIAGIYKRRRLEAPDGEVTRPTADRIKESLFNIIAPEIEETAVLDLFAGSGSLGIEALSRGARSVVFVEKNKPAINMLKKNLDNLNVNKDHYHIIERAVEDFLIMPLKFSYKFDIIFADPPYNTDWISSGLQMLEDSGYCKDECLLIFERSSKDKHGKKESKPISVQNWSLQDIRNYGKTQLEFWRRNHD